jgi:urease accessory protein
MAPVFSPSSIGSEPNFRSPIERAGRDGALRLGFERRRGQTVLAERRFTLPLQAFDAVPMDGDGSVCLMLLNPTGGLVGGDRLKTEIALGPDTHVCLTTSSATKVYRTLGPPAIQETAIRIGAGAILEYIPDHVIPHPGSVFHQSLTVEMGPKSRVILADAFAIGRLARGERWSFAEIVNRITVRSCGRPVFLDWMKIDPSRQRAACMDGFGYVATVGLLADGVVAWEKIVHDLQQEFVKSPSIEGAASLLSSGGCVVRLLARSAPDLTQAVRILWTLARRLLLDLPAVDLRKR